jgi:flavin reductase (DIM6/NTAB) family NADH-FMN oxidoreductase RutF
VDGRPSRDAESVVGPVPGGQDPDAYDRLRRRILWAMPAGLYVVGSRGAQGAAGTTSDGRARNLMTCNWCQQVSVRPKMVAVSIDREAVTAGLVRAGGVFSVNLIDREDRALVRRYVKPVTDAVFDDEGRVASMGGQPTMEAATGAPILARAAAWVDCEVRHEVPLGSHVLFVGEVVDVGVGAGGADGLERVLRMEDTRMSYGG